MERQREGKAEPSCPTLASDPRHQRCEVAAMLSRISTLAVGIKDLGLYTPIILLLAARGSGSGIANAYQDALAGGDGDRGREEYPGGTAVYRSLTGERRLRITCSCTLHAMHTARLGRRPVCIPRPAGAP